MLNLKNMKVLLIVFLLLITGVFLYYFIKPKSYNTIQKVSYSDGTIMSGYSCECFGVKNEIQKECTGILYSCYSVK